MKKIMNFKIFKALDKKFIKTLFEEKHANYFPQSSPIESIEIERTSPVWAKESCLARYKIFFKGKKIKRLRGSAHIVKTKKKSWQVMRYLYNHGFNQGNLQVSRPLDFLKEINFLIYEEVPGETLSYIVEENNISKINKEIERIANWLTKLHNLSLPKKKIPKATFLNIKNYSAAFDKIKKLMPEIKRYLIPIKKLKFIKEIFQEKKTIIHNDFYPGNIILDKKKVYVIDFDKSGYGPFLSDIATFYSSFESPKEIWEKLTLSQKNTKKIQKFFIETYCRLNRINIKTIEKKLPLFLTKNFLDQLHGYTYLAVKGWKFTTKEGHKDFANKIKSLLIKTREYLSKI